MKIFIYVIFTIMLMVYVCGCSSAVKTDENDQSGDVNNPYGVEEDSNAGAPTTEQNIAPHEEAPLYSIAENPTTYDFSILSVEDFPAGIWTVNQLIKKYGTPEKVVGNYLPQYHMVFVNVVFDHITIHFYPKGVEVFSFFDNNYDLLEAKDYELNENDRNLELDIMALRFNDSASIELPYDSKIGQTKKADVIAAYGEGPAYSNKNESLKIDSISYKYSFPKEELPEGESEVSAEGTTDYDIGRIVYFFDENEVLNEVIIEWMSYDL